MSRIAKWTEMGCSTKKQQHQTYQFREIQDAGDYISEGMFGNKTHHTNLAIVLYLQISHTSFSVSLESTLSVCHLPWLSRLVSLHLVLTISCLDFCLTIFILSDNILLFRAAPLCSRVLYLPSPFLSLFVSISSTSFMSRSITSCLILSSCCLLYTSPSPRD